MKDDGARQLIITSGLLWVSTYAQMFMRTHSTNLKDKKGSSSLSSLLLPVMRSESSRIRTSPASLFRGERRQLLEGLRLPAEVQAVDLLKSRKKILSLRNTSPKVFCFLSNLVIIQGPKEKGDFYLFTS